MENNGIALRKPVKILDGIPMLIICIVICIALYILGITKTFSNNTMRYLLKIFLYITMGEMWNLMSGFTGMTSLGQQVFVGIAGYSVAVFTSTFKMSMWLGLLVGAVIGVVFALLLSLILFRMRGMYFAVATWLIAEAVRLWFNSWRFVKQGAGMTIATSQIPKVRELYIYALTLCIIALVVVYILLRTKTGLGLTAMRDDADASSSVGVNIFKSKLLCYLICSLFIALAGGMFALQKGSVLPSSSFSIDWTVAMVFIVIIGGVGTMAGPILGGIVYVILSEFLAHFPGWSNIILGAIAILVIIFLPDGIIGTLQKKLNFEIFSQKRLSEPKKVKGLKEKANMA
ncbi:MAG: branched-chain amino acid ABC transporter permease [Lachnospiraceae bacterium]|nr:branched-chain amino acid ABC transporter permease [Lachnospiraceae bacterium]